MRTRKMTDRMLLEGLVNKYGAKRLTNVINEMEVSTNHYPNYSNKNDKFNVAYDLCKMIISQFAYRPESMHGYFNYGEDDSWASKYPELCQECMDGDGIIAEKADNVMNVLKDFINVIK